MFVKILLIVDFGVYCLLLLIIVLVLTFRSELDVIHRLAWYENEWYLTTCNLQAARFLLFATCKSNSHIVLHALP